MTQITIDRQKCQQALHKAVEAALAKHKKACGIGNDADIESEITIDKQDTVTYYVITPEGKRKVLLRGRLLYKPFFEIKRFKV